jgi:hypothetical protein
VIWFYFIGRKKYKIVKSNFLLYENNFVANIYIHTHTGNRVQEIKLQTIKDLIIILKNCYAYNIL